MIFRKWLTYSMDNAGDINNLETILLHRHLIEKKPFLKLIYEEWYTIVSDAIPNFDGPILELGSGAGFMKKFVPNLITSDVFHHPFVDITVNGCQLPFADKSLRAIVMTDVLHHIPCCKSFFSEATRCVKPKGVVIMIEPWVTKWSRFVYSTFHHEPFLPDTKEWEFSGNNSFKSANGALPWIIFERDRICFELEFPEWQIETIRLIMPFRYLISGGLSFRCLMPAQTYVLWKLIETALKPWAKYLAMFAYITLRRTDTRPYLFGQAGK